MLNMESTELKVTCINKANRNSPDTRITHVGIINEYGFPLKLTLEEIIERINGGAYKFYVDRGFKVFLKVVEGIDRKVYLRTEDDDSDENNLLSLPECS